jgi:2-polyprenyl-3-methyl-5-hydroxy-6-metoxy-1,4-benzoquinol methylase
MISSPNRSTPSAEGFLARRARLRRIAARFDVSLPTRGYIIGKIATDPAYRAVLEQCTDSPFPIIDIGCGLGLLAHYLREHGCPTLIHGFDFDARKIELARRAAKRAGLTDVSFAVGDVADVPPHESNLVLLDVLHYLEVRAQQRLLQTLADRARAGGTVIIRSALRENSWRYRLTLAQEHWTRWSGWINSPAPIRFPSAAEIAAPFLAAGCRCEALPLWGRTPFNSHLFVARYAE